MIVNGLEWTEQDQYEYEIWLREQGYVINYD